MGEVMKKGGSFLIEATAPADVFTPEDFSEEQLAIAKVAKDFVHGSVAPMIEQLEALDIDLTVQLLRQAGELGLLAADVEEAYDGLGLDKVSSTLITESLAPAGSFSLSFGAHVGIGTLPIVYFGTEAQKKTYLPALASGEKLAAYCLTEPGSGSDALGAKAKAVLTEDGSRYILNGAKQFITNGGFADVFIVYAKVDGEKFSAFIVEKGFPGVSLGPEEKKMGIQGSSTRAVILDNVPVPAENLLGEVGKGHLIAFNILNIGRYKLAAGCVGAAKHALGLSVRYAKEREQFQTPIAQFPLIREKLADMAVKTFAAETLVYRTAGDMERALGAATPLQAISEYAIECSINKVLASEALDAVVDEGVQIHGGYGFIQEYEIERMYRDSRINRIFEGTNEINRLLIPGTLLKKAMKGELPLLAAAQRLQGELLSLAGQVEDNAPLAVEGDLVGRMKKLVLFIAGLAVRKYQAALEKEQEILRNLSELIIQVYAMESVVLRAGKNQGGEKGELQADYARAYVFDHLGAMEKLARDTLAAMEEGDALRTQLSVVKKLVRHTPVNLKEIKRRIAGRVLAAEGYVS